MEMIPIDRGIAPKTISKLSREDQIKVHAWRVECKTGYSVENDRLCMRPLLLQKTSGVVQNIRQN
jgi:hypothetical protein